MNNISEKTKPARDGLPASLKTDNLLMSRQEITFKHTQEFHNIGKELYDMLIPFMGKHNLDFIAVQINSKRPNTAGSSFYEFDSDNILEAQRKDKRITPKLVFE